MEAVDGEEVESPDYLEKDCLPGWPDRFKIVKTSAGIQIFEFRLGEDEEVKGDDGRILFIDKAQERRNPLTGIIEKGFDCGNLNRYNNNDFYLPILNSRERALNCLRGEGNKNFAQPENPLS